MSMFPHLSKDKIPNDFEINNLLFSGLKYYECFSCRTVRCRSIVQHFNPCGNFRPSIQFCQEIKCTYCRRLRFIRRRCFLMYKIRFNETRDGVLFL